MNDDPNRLVAVFTEALQLPVDERAGYLERSCADDDELRNQVKTLLDAYEDSGTFLEQPAQKIATAGNNGVALGVTLGDRIGRYKILQQIGEGGWGVVYMAEQEEPVRRKVALKVIKPGMDTKSVIARFEAERQALAMMDHPNIAKVFDAGATENGRPYFVMELVRGIRLTDYCDEHSLSTAERLDLFVQICHAVQHAHQKGIIHRDLKPSNILVTTTAEGTALPKVIDFGIAKATSGERLTDKTLFTAFELLIGTPAYMSPEQAALTSVDVDTRTDIYSLGVLLYELLTSTTPFDTHELLKAGLDEVRRVIRNEEPLPPSARLGTMMASDLTSAASSRRANPPRLIRTIRGDLDWIVMKALEKDRARRYQTANGLALDIQHFLANETISARPPSAFYKLQKTLLRHKLLFTAAGIILLLLVAGLIGAAWLLKRETEARRDAVLARQQAEKDKGKAEEEAARSGQVTRFLEEMLQGAGPSAAKGRDTTMLKEILEKAAARLDTDLASQPAIQSELRRRLARTYWELGQYAESEAMLRQALATTRMLFGEKSEAASDVMGELGHVLMLQTKNPEAERIIREALAIRQQLLGDEHSKVAESYTLLGGIFWRQERLLDAETMLRKALDSQRRLLGEQAPGLGDSLVGLGNVLFRQGKHNEAEDLFRQALNNWQNVLGEDHPSVIAALQNLASALSAQGESSEAETLYRRVVATTRKIFGEQHPLLTTSLDVFANFLMREGRVEEAEDMYRQALTPIRKSRGDLHPDVLQILNNLATALRAQKKLNDLELLLNDFLTLENLRKPQCVPLLSMRAEFFARSSRWSEAIADAAKILEYEPSNHLHYHTLAPLLAAAKDSERYRELCRKIVDRFHRTTNPYIADRMAKDCLIAPLPDIDLKKISAMADVTLAVNKGELVQHFFYCCKAMAEFRNARFESAGVWARRAFDSASPYVKAEAYAVFAMAQYQQNQPGEAHNALSKTEEIVKSQLPEAGSKDLGEDWRDWIIAHTLMTEARDLINGIHNAKPNSDEK